MNYKQILSLAKSLNYFEDTEFVSVIDDKKILVKNKNTQDTWAIDYRIDESVMTFDTTHSEIVEQVKDEEKTLKDISREIVKNIFIDRDKDFYAEAKEKIMSCVRKKKGKKEKKPVELKTNYTETYDKLSPEAKEIVNNIYKKTNSKINSISEMTEEFLSNSAFMFESQEIKKGIYVDPILVLEAYKNKVSKREKFFESVDGFVSFEKAVAEIFEESDIPLENVKTVFEGIQLGSDIGTNVTKNLLKIKKDNALKFNISEMAKNIKVAYGEQFDTDDLKEYSEMGLLSGVLSGITKDSAHVLNSDRYKYLQFNSFGMQMEDVRDILKDIDLALSHFMGMNEDHFGELMYLRQIVETCYKTGNIDSELILNSVRSFNSKFITSAPAVEVVAVGAK